MDSPPGSGAASPPTASVESPTRHIDIYEGKTVLSDDDEASCAFSPSTPMTEMIPRELRSPEESVSIISSMTQRRDGDRGDTSSSSSMTTTATGDSVSIISSVAGGKRRDAARHMTSTDASESFSVVSAAAGRSQPAGAGAELKPLKTDTTASESFSFISSVVRDKPATPSGKTRKLCVYKYMWQCTSMWNAFFPLFFLYFLLFDVVCNGKVPLDLLFLFLDCTPRSPIIGQCP